MKKNFNLFNWLFDNNPVFTMMLSMCTVLAITTTFENGLVMGISVSFVLFFSSLFVSLLSKYISNDLRIPSYILIIATLVTALEIVLRKHFFSVYETLGVFLPLITVNCIILSKILSVASKEKVKTTVLDSLKTGAQYIFALVLFASIREVLGKGTLTIIDNLSTLFNKKIIINILKPGLLLPNNMFLTSAGAFISLGLLLAVLNKIRDRGEAK